MAGKAAASGLREDGGRYGIPHLESGGEAGS